MLPYTVIKEANPPQFGGTATGVINFLNFTFSALLGPVFGWILQRVSGGAAQMELAALPVDLCPAAYGVAIAIVLRTVVERDGTGSAQRSPAASGG